MANKNLNYRLATPEDVLEIQKLVESAFQASDTRVNWTSHQELNIRFRISVENIMLRIQDPDSAVLMAFLSESDHEDPKDETFVASIEVVKRSSELAHLSMLAVSPDHHRDGIGRKILNYAENYCQQEWGVTKLALNALSDREALIAWYTRRGYQRTGETKPFPVEEFSDLPLSDNLCFVQFEKNVNTLPSV